MWKVNGQQTTDAKWWQRLTLPLARWAKNARCESLLALLHYVKWDRIITLTGAQADWGLRFRIYDQMYKEMKKNRSLINPFQLNAYQKASISQQSSVYCWSQTQTRKRRRISRFCRSMIFFGIKNVRVGGKILGLVGRSETHILFFLA